MWWGAGGLRDCKQQIRGWREGFSLSGRGGQAHFSFVMGAPKAISFVQPSSISSVECTFPPKMQVKNPSSELPPALDYGSK